MNSRTAEMKNKSVKFLNRDGLKLLAMGLMLLDHLWATVVPGNNWMTYAGRLAFPIFAFQAAEGSRRTSSFRNYALRLLIWGFLSEIPFNLMYSGRFLNPFHQNVIFTLLLGILLYRCAGQSWSALTEKKIRKFLLYLTGIFGCLLGGLIGFPDYGLTGVLTTAMFCCFSDRKYVNLFRTVCLFLLFEVFFKGEILLIPAFGTVLEIGKEALGILAIIPIMLYNGEKGRGGRVMQWLGYAFYPVHMVVLHLIRYFL